VQVKVIVLAIALLTANLGDIGQERPLLAIDELVVFKGVLSPFLHVLQDDLVFVLQSDIGAAVRVGRPFGHLRAVEQGPGRVVEHVQVELLVAVEERDVAPVHSDYVAHFVADG